VAAKVKPMPTHIWVESAELFFVPRALNARPRVTSPIAYQCSVTRGRRDFTRKIFAQIAVKITTDE
jgi:hypothetical protein